MLSKLNKFINQPRWFFKDAFKKRENLIAVRLDAFNAQLKAIGVPLQLDIDIIEQSFINTAVKLTHYELINQSILYLVTLRKQPATSTKKTTSEQFQQLRQNLAQQFPHVLIRHTFEVSINPPVGSVNLGPELAKNVLVTGKSQDLAETRETRPATDEPSISSAISPKLSSRAKLLHARFVSEASTLQ